MDLSLLITIGLIFLITLAGAFLRSRRKDRCLKSWEGFHVTLERASGKLVWGVLHLEPTGMELSYLDSVQDEKHIESTYLLYGSEYGDIQAIYRYADRLSEWGKQRRLRDVERSFHPGLLRRLGRSLRNFLSTATDSLNEVFSLVLGRVGKAGGRYLAADGSIAIKAVGGKVLGQVGAIYDPLLEHYIGQRVVIELQEGDEVHEHVGLLREYSADFIEVLDVPYPELQTVTLPQKAAFESNWLAISVFGDALRVTNTDGRPVLVKSIRDSDEERLINAVVDSGETIELHPGFEGSDPPKLHIQVVRELDMIVPRSRCVVRHRAELYHADDLSSMVLDLVFDVGTALSQGGKRDNQEVMLRQELQSRPDDASAAANLGFLLMQKDELAEAEKWLRRALCSEYSLPDSGRRVRMQLREIARRRLESTRELFGAGRAEPAAAPVDDAGPHI